MSSTSSTSTSSSSSSSSVAQLKPDYSLSNIKKQLVTKEDHLYIHKILGISCLLSFLFRYSQILLFGNDMGFSAWPKLTLPTMILHLTLNLSSFEFHIPRQRIKHGGRIWPEARLHSLCFALRSISIIVLYYIEDKYNLKPNYYMNFAICFANLLFVDLSSTSQGTYQSNTIRGLECSPHTKYFFSIMQFNYMSTLIFGVRKCTPSFVGLFTVQLSAFLATMQRKNLIGYTGLAIYGGMLTSSFFVTRQVHLNAVDGGAQIDYAIRIFGLTAALLRMGYLPTYPILQVFRPLQNKYVIWSLIGYSMNTMRPYYSEIPIEKLQFILGGLVVAHLVNYHFKKEYYYKDVDSIKSNNVVVTTTKKKAA